MPDAIQYLDEITGAFFTAVELARMKKRREINTARDRAINSGCTTPLGWIDTNEASRLKITGAVITAMLAKSAGSAYSIVWTMLDNSNVVHTADQMIALGVAAGLYAQACHQIGETAKAALALATTEAQIAAIDVEALPWP